MAHHQQHEKQQQRQVTAEVLIMLIRDLGKRRQGHIQPLQNLDQIIQALTTG